MCRLQRLAPAQRVHGPAGPRFVRGAGRGRLGARRYADPSRRTLHGNRARARCASDSAAGTVGFVPGPYLWALSVCADRSASFRNRVALASDAVARRVLPQEPPGPIVPKCGFPGAATSAPIGSVPLLDPLTGSARRSVRSCRTRGSQAAKLEGVFVGFLFDQVEATRDFVDTSLNFALVVLLVGANRSRAGSTPRQRTHGRSLQPREQGCAHGRPAGCAGLDQFPVCVVVAHEPHRAGEGGSDARSGASLRTRIQTASRHVFRKLLCHFQSRQ